MRILMLADGGAPTGFARVSHAIGDRLVRDFGHEVSILAANWRGDHVDSPMHFYLPTQLERLDVYGRSRFVELLGKLMPDAIWMVNDASVMLDHFFDNPWDDQGVLWGGYALPDGTLYRPPIIAYLTADGYDAPKSWDMLKNRVIRVAMSKFGRDTLMPEAPVVWHGVDTTIFHPIDKADAKRALGFDPGHFLILRTDKNSIRKDYPATWKAVRPVLRRHSDIDVHFHCLPRTPDGYNLNAVRFNDEDIRDRVTYSSDVKGYSGIPDEQMALLYSAADLYVSTSWGEGFGLPLLEAMACGTPVIAQNCSAITEVVGPGGVLIEPKARISTPQGQDQCLPDIEAFTAEIEHLYEAGGVRRKFGKEAVDHARTFSWDYAASAMDGLIRGAVEGQKAPPLEVPEPVH
jgi:glycosyltransferase involved in cell wall biosynthesis